MQDTYTLFQIIQMLGGAVSTIAVPIIVWINHRLTKLEEDSSNYKVKIAETYLKQDRFAQFENSINEKLDKILDKLDKKVDK